MYVCNSEWSCICEYFEMSVTAFPVLIVYTHGGTPGARGTRADTLHLAHSSLMCRNPLCIISHVSHMCLFCSACGALSLSNAL